jgi:peptidoglycan/xylan/chitin deacetylase (PgdA/CDA1 family)
MPVKKINGAISIDTDSLDLIYYAFKNKRLSENDVTYKKILPKYLEFFKQRRIEATFFIIGSHIKTSYHKSMLRKIVDEGHELANHTFNHYLNFSKLSKDEKEEEILKCENIIEETVGIKPVGFRAPGWDIDSETMKILEKHKYIYDSSVYPTYFNMVSLAYLFIMNKGITHTKSIGSIKNTFAPLKPYHPNLNKIHTKGKSKIIELPINVTPFLRIPFFGTLLFASKSKTLFNYSLNMIRLSKMPLNYELHTVELYDKNNDNIDNDIRKIRHPCIYTPLTKKKELYNYVFQKFNKYYKMSTLRNLVNSSKK